MDKEKRNILIIDDDELILQTIRLCFGKDFEIFSAQNAQDAFQVLSKTNVSLILLDVNLPDIMGPDLLRLLIHFQKHLQKEQVHLLQALVLAGLFFEERPVRPTQLAKIFSATRSNMSHALRDLEKKRFIERNSSHDDARAYFFTLTKEGKRKVPRLIKIFDSFQDKIESAPGGKRITSALILFRTIYQDISK